MIRAAAAALFILAKAPVMASPSGTWPEEAKGVSLPQAEWVLVIPARRVDDGSVRVWDQHDPWTKEWKVPKATPGGTRTIAIIGDSEDRRLVDGWQIDSMDIGALQRLASKYSAPAVAVAIVDGSGETAVAGWMPGQDAAWTPSEHPGGKEGTLASLDRMFSGSEGQPAPDVLITGQRGGVAGTEYRLQPASEIISEVLRGIPGLEVSGYIDGEDGKLSLVVSVNDGQDIETVLRSAGLEVGF